MSTNTIYNRRAWVLLTALLLLLSTLPAFAGINDLFVKKEDEPGCCLQLSSCY